MENLIFCANAVLPVFVMIAVGYFIRDRMGFSPDILRTLNMLCYQLLLPSIMFRSAYNAPISESLNLRLYLSIVVFLLGAILLMRFVAPRFTSSRAQIGSMLQGSFRSNVVLLGIPIVVNLVGEDGAGPVGILAAILVPLYNVFCVMIFSIYTNAPDNRVSFKSVLHNIFTNPMIVSAFIGIAFSLANIRLPVIIERPISDFADAATPMAMLVLGAMLDFKNVFRNIRLTAVTLSVKLILLPLAGTLYAILAGFRGANLCAFYVVLASPLAVGSVAMADVMGGDGALSAELVVFSTASSVVTIFLGSFILKSLGYI